MRRTTMMVPIEAPTLMPNLASVREFGAAGVWEIRGTVVVGDETLDVDDGKPFTLGFTLVVEALSAADPCVLSAVPTEGPAPAEGTASVEEPAPAVIKDGWDDEVTRPEPELKGGQIINN